MGKSCVTHLLNFNSSYWKVHWKHTILYHLQLFVEDNPCSAITLHTIPIWTAHQWSDPASNWICHSTRKVSKPFEFGCSTSLMLNKLGYDLKWIHTFVKTIGSVLKRNRLRWFGHVKRKKKRIGLGNVCTGWAKKVTSGKITISHQLFGGGIPFHINQFALGKRHWDLETSSAVVEFPPLYR